MSETFAPIPFLVPFEGHHLVGDLIGESSQNALLLLHGGNKGRSIFSIRQALAQNGVSTVAFDFIGHGDTVGDLANSSLHSRTQQAAAVLDFHEMRAPISVLGISMGAYNAVHLASERPVANLILEGPAAYCAEAYHLPFGPQFKQCISQTNSWERSDAWDKISRFRGQLLVVTAEHDTVIPKEIPRRLVESARQASTAELYVVPGAQHIGLLADPANREYVVGCIIQSCRTISTHSTTPVLSLHASAEVEKTVAVPVLQPVR